MLRSITCLVVVMAVACGGVGKPAPEPQPDTVRAPSNPAIHVTAPAVDAIVSSPLVVTGEARGTWFFEATFPVTLLDADGKPIVSGYAQAQGEWMTEQMVPFKTELVFATPSSANGTLVLEKANPSDLPEHDAEVRVPVRFR